MKQESHYRSPRLLVRFCEYFTIDRVRLSQRLVLLRRRDHRDQIGQRSFGLEQRHRDRLSPFLDIDILTVAEDVDH